uniref:DUF5619 domain-containing protein n=1 Tax=Archaeoglobus fulgidus TaxID=2234 RepID=A0A7J2TL55_ARCFL
MEEIVIEREFGFEEAEKLAKKIANERGNAILLAYCGARTGLKFPDVNCCGERSWEVYARSRGGNLKIRIGDFEFIFRVD